MSNPDQEAVEPILIKTTNSTFALGREWSKVKDLSIFDKTRLIGTPVADDFIREYPLSNDFTWEKSENTRIPDSDVYLVQHVYKENDGIVIPKDIPVKNVNVVFSGFKDFSVKFTAYINSLPWFRNSRFKKVIIGKDVSAIRDYLDHEDHDSNLYILFSSHQELIARNSEYSSSIYSNTRSGNRVSSPMEFRSVSNRESRTEYQNRLIENFSCIEENDRSFNLRSLDVRPVEITIFEGLGFGGNNLTKCFIPSLERNNIIIIPGFHNQITAHGISFLNEILSEPSLVEFAEKIYSADGPSEDDIAQYTRIMTDAFYTNLLRARTNRLESDLNTHRNYVTSTRNAYVEASRKLSDTMERLSNTNYNTRQFVEKLQAGIQSASGIEGVKNIFIERGLMMIHTEFMYFEGPDKKIYELGEFEIRVNLTGTGFVHFKNKNKERYGRSATYHAPHIFSGGDPCFGNLGPVITEFIMNLEIENLTARLLEFLQSVNPNDQIGQYYGSWKRTDETVEKWRERVSR